MRSSIILTFSFVSVLFAQTQLGSYIDGEAADDWLGRSVSLNSDGASLTLGQIPFTAHTITICTSCRKYLH